MGLRDQNPALQIGSILLSSILVPCAGQSEDWPVSLLIHQSHILASEPTEAPRVRHSPAMVPFTNTDLPSFSQWMKFHGALDAGRRARLLTVPLASNVFDCPLASLDDIAAAHT